MGMKRGKTKTLDETENEKKTKHLRWVFNFLTLHKSWSFLLGRQEFIELPALKLAIANDYRELSQFDLAVVNYQETVAIAKSN